MFVFAEREKAGRRFVGGKNKRKAIRSSILGRPPNELSIGKKQFHRANRKSVQIGHGVKVTD